jgi:hypothetical protein
MKLQPFSLGATQELESDGKKMGPNKQKETEFAPVLI